MEKKNGYISWRQQTLPMAVDNCPNSHHSSRRGIKSWTLTSSERVCKQQSIKSNAGLFTSAFLWITSGSYPPVILLISTRSKIEIKSVIDTREPIYVLRIAYTGFAVSSVGGWFSKYTLNKCELPRRHDITQIATMKFSVTRMKGY